jgi:hypothetical protein
MKVVVVFGLCLLLITIQGLDNKPEHVSKAILDHPDIQEFLRQSDVATANPKWIEDIVIRLAKASTNFLAERPDIIPVTSYCLQGYIKEGSSFDGCGDLATTLTTIASQFANNPETVTLLKQIRYEGVMRLPSNDKTSLPMPPTEPPHVPHGLGTRPVPTLPEGMTITMYEQAAYMLWAFLIAHEIGQHTLYRKYPTTSDPHNLAERIPKWKVIKAIFPTFERWYHVYNKEATNLRALSGGVKKICTDFVPFLMEDYTNDFKWREGSPFKGHEEAYAELYDYWNPLRNTKFRDAQTPGLEISKKDVASCWQIMEFVIDHFNDNQPEQFFFRWSNVPLILPVAITGVLTILALIISVKYFSFRHDFVHCSLSSFNDYLTNDEQWYCPKRGGYVEDHSVCFRTCSTVSTKYDLRIRHLLTLCDEGRLYPALAQIWSGNQCGIVSGRYSQFELAAIKV